MGQILPRHRGLSRGEIEARHFAKRVRQRIGRLPPFGMAIARHRIASPPLLGAKSLDRTGYGGLRAIFPVKMMNVKIGLIGFGHWGPNYLRVFSEMDGCEVVACCEIDPNKLKKSARSHGRLKLSSDHKELIADPEVDAVVVTTPAKTHYEIARLALLCRKHLLVEKPLALSLDEAEELIELAEDSALVLMVGHTFLYHKALRKVKEYIDSGDAGRIYYLQSTRTHMGLIRADVGALWDLAPHDVSIFNFLLGEIPCQVSAVAGCYLDGYEDVAFATFSYPSGALANMHVSWLNANKVRSLEVIGSRARIVFDDIDNLEKVRLFQKGVSLGDGYSNFGEFQYLLRDGDIISPKIDLAEPLKDQCVDFLRCIWSGSKPLSDGQSGLEVVRALEAAERSIRGKGSPVALMGQKMAIGAKGGGHGTFSQGRR